MTPLHHINTIQLYQEPGLQIATGGSQGGKTPCLTLVASWKSQRLNSGSSLKKIENYDYLSLANVTKKYFKSLLCLVYLKWSQFALISVWETSPFLGRGHDHPLLHRRSSTNQHTCLPMSLPHSAFSDALRRHQNNLTWVQSRVERSQTWRRRLAKHRNLHLFYLKDGHNSLTLTMTGTIFKLAPSGWSKKSAPLEVASSVAGL